MSAFYLLRSIAKPSRVPLWAFRPRIVFLSKNKRPISTKTENFLTTLKAKSQSTILRIKRGKLLSVKVVYTEKVETRTPITISSRAWSCPKTTNGARVENWVKSHWEVLIVEIDSSSWNVIHFLIVDALKYQGFHTPVACKIDETGYLKHVIYGTYIMDSDGSLIELTVDEQERALLESLITLTWFQKWMYLRVDGKFEI